MSRLFIRRIVVIFCAVALPAGAQTNAPVAATAPAGTNAVAQATSVAPLATNGAGISAPVVRVDPFSDPLIKVVQARQEKAFHGDTKETKALTLDLEKWTKAQPDNHLLQAYLGSVYTLDSRDAWPGPGKLTYLRNGGNLLDAAVAAAPNNPAVRFVRAIDYFELPSIFGKGKTARDDFAILLRIVEGQEKTDYLLNIETQQAIAYFAGLCAKKTADAHRIWQEGLALDPNSALGKKMSEELGGKK